MRASTLSESQEALVWSLVIAGLELLVGVTFVHDLLVEVACSIDYCSNGFDFSSRSIVVWEF